MSISLVQSKTGTSDTSASSFGVTFTSTTGAAHGLIGFVYWYNSGGPATTDLSSVTDGTNSYTIVDRQAFTGVHQACCASFAAANASAINTVTANFGVNPGRFRMIIAEYSGVATSSLVNKHAVNLQASPPGTGTDAVTSGAQTPTVNGCQIVGFTVCSTANLPTHGTGYVTQQTITNSGDADSQSFEDQNQATAASIAATWTAINNGDAFMSMMLALAPAALSTLQRRTFDYRGSQSGKRGVILS